MLAPVMPPTLRHKPTNPLISADWTVEPIPLPTARWMVEHFHYARGGSNTACYTFGLIHRQSRLVHGASWFLPPTRSAAEFNCAGRDWRRVLSLSRLAIAPQAPTNSCSFLISKSVQAIRKDSRFDVIITYADQWQGHTGHIYLACGWEYLGETKKFPTYVDPTGKLVARKATITRTHAELIELGCRCVGRFAKHRYRLILR